MPFIQTNSGHSLNYSDSHPTGPPTPTSQTLIFIHGLGSSQNYYYPVISHLTDTHRCITLDTYGAARSPYTGNETISIPDIAQDVIGVLDALNIPKAIAVGHSMGGLVVIELGVRYRDRVQGVIAIGPTHPSEGLVGVMEKRAGTVLESGMEPMANTIPYAAVGSRSTPLQKAFIRELILGQSPEGYAALCRAIASAEAPDYTAVKAPFLLIAGEEDKSASMEGCRHIYEHVSSQWKSLEVLKGVGHWHCIEAADEVGALIVSFVGELRY
ncbi:Alpha/beta hydrolase fold-1 [Penicillium sp. DV-2018c]|nr:Alpha/beta hydrolase fold-1 [Penicillium sp. DV-2018c]KAJ5581928.1 Alpha/beta hydrolase fold-1 [Penicillium sp. DV-2018c]